MNFGNDKTAKRLASVVSNAAYLSKLATGDMEISDRRARSIEKELGFPGGWMDRYNIGVLKTSAEDLAVLNAISQLSTEAKTNLFRFLASCGEA
jgi:hypothetical protein